MAVAAAATAVLVEGGPVQPHKYVFAERTVVQVCSDTVVRVARVPEAGNLTAVDERVSLIAKRDWEPVEPKIASHGGVTNLTTKNFVVSVEESTGVVSFFDLEGKLIVNEVAHSFTPVVDMGNPTYAIEQAWGIGSDESLYGGGEFQNGFLDFNNVPIQLVQFNTEAVVPFFVSSNGYGILWDNYAWTHLNSAKAKELEFTPVGDDVSAPSNGSLPVGTSIIGSPCHDRDTATTRQFWAYNNTDLRFHSMGENPEDDLVLDYDQVHGNLHLWVNDPKFDFDQQWALVGEVIQSQSQQVSPPLCLQAVKKGKSGSKYYVSAAECDPENVMQQWEVTDASQIMLSDGSNTCLTADTAGIKSKYSFKAPESGTYGFYVQACSGFGCGMNKVLQLNITSASDGEEMLIDWEALTNLPDAVSARVALKQGTEYTVTVSMTNLNTLPQVFMTTPEKPTTSLASDLGDLIDYYFTFENHHNIDGAIRGYRAVTGDAPLYARWVYGFWQCKEHYDTQNHLLEAARGYRSRSIPIDNIVQDWHYWGNLGWGPQWDPEFYPDPAEMVAELSNMNMQLMVSVWSKFDNGTKFFDTMSANGEMLDGSIYYDAWNPMGREQFYQYSKEAHFDIGVACLWLDATEPEGFPNINASVYLGTGNALFNSYSLMTTKAISDGLRADFPDEQGARVFSLTRSSFAGQQKNGAALWSGDISGVWDSLRRQVAASLNYQLSGIPYWSEDMGGFFRPNDQYTSSDYHMLLVRWFQFGCFTPIYRVHGGGSNTEIWNYGKEVESLLNATNNLRYRLLPYNYAGFYRVEVEGYTMQRALVFDFPTDVVARRSPDQFMWGDALMVAPMLSNTSKRDVYLPEAMVDFNSGASMSKGLHSNVAVPLKDIALYARPGAILALGPLLQWTGEKPADPLEVRVYNGADGVFTLFEDDGASADYRTGAASSIKFTFHHANKTLAIGARQGAFPGMLESRKINVVFVSAEHGVGPDVTPAKDIDHEVHYTGEAVTVTAPKGW